ncbi:DEAD/DEAH box helicase family protein (plasmid) [Haloferax larsenii]|uniref:DEAD/DEAH box helicase family protein n=1 Tax=Haloferax larsenii TaxID=302484 RepID=A0ABY5RIT7_HALLR|nr:helicase-related protein [Haloferax larsenii]UVE51970.1 DEAD/DEAH box helicase family protein [Haloferax larsenii]
MSTGFRVGDQVAFYGGEGNVVDISEGMLRVLTGSGSIREVPMTLPMLRKVGVSEEGDLVDFLGGRATVVASQSRENGPDLLYLRTEDGELKKVPADAQGLTPGKAIGDRLATGEFDEPVRFSLRERAARLSLAYRSNRFLSLSGNRIRIEPYQVDAAHRVLTAYEPRFLIGDEVGLGKTIEAGIIIEELIARGRANRVLIITPAGLRDQWQDEMQEKFGREYIAYDRGYVDSLRAAQPGKNIWTHDDHVVVSIDFAKQDDMLADLQNLKHSWDVVVIDEAHHLTARESSDGVKRVDRYRVGEAVSHNTNALLFLTGTPHKGKQDQFFHLLRLLDPYRFRGPSDISPEKLSDLMIRRVKSDKSMIDAEGKPMFPGRKITTLPVSLTPEERRLYDDLTEYISAIYTANVETDRHAAGFTMVIYQKRLVSSIKAIANSLQKRRDELETKTLVSKDIATRLYNVDDSVKTEGDVLDQLIAAANSIPVDSKGRRLREFVRQVLREDQSEKILLFTEYTDTLEYLRDDVLADVKTVEIHGGMNQSERHSAIKRFKQDAAVMLATDAAREGLNLQFAHIMVNYDLPWNPTRIDQRIGRLHRYGQERMVEIRNLFVDDTRESDILELLLNKLDEIEETLGMSSDVLGLVLENVDLEEQIMTAIAQKDSTDSIAADLDAIVEDQEEAVRRVDEELLIRDRFDLSEEDREILDIIDESAEDTISEADVEYLVRTVCNEFGGRIVNVRSGPADDGGDVFDLVVPDPISGGEVKDRYDGATFDRKNAVEDESLEFIALDHPVVRSMMQFCLDSDAVGGQTAVLTGGRDLATPGLLCHFRVGYLSGTGDTVTERLVQVYVTPDGVEQTGEINITGGLPPSAANDYPAVEAISECSDELVKRAEAVAWAVIEDLAAEAREDRQREARIRREHTQKYFEYRIDDLEERIERFEERDTQPDEDMRIVLAKAQSQLKELKNERDAELARLEEEEQVIPDEPELINMAAVVDAFDD